MRRSTLEATWIICAAVLVAACNGKDGVQGKAARDTGVIAGTATSSLGGGAAGVSVRTVPASATATTSAAGAFSLTVPIGVYEVVFESPAYTTGRAGGVSVVAGGSAAVLVTLARLNPLAASAPAVHQAGFGKPVTLGVSVTGATGAVSHTWTQTGGPTASLSSATAAAPTFTTASLDAILTGGTVSIPREPRAGVVPLHAQQVDELAYRFQVTVFDGTFTTTAEAVVEPASWQAGGYSVPRGVLVVVNDAEAPSYGWSLAGPPGSTAALEAPATRNPWFVPDVKGTYTLTNAAPDPDTVLTVRADDWLGSGAGSCGTCHSTRKAEWQATKHASMLQRALDGALGYYAPECLRCHTLGYAPAAQNGGFDDVAASLSWTLPAPAAGAWAALPAALKEKANVQCESCHGPGSDHGGVPGTMVPSFSAAACATCHQEEPYHDAPGLWSQSGHANLDAALVEGTTESRGTTAAHCGRCHSAQGFARWSQQLLAGSFGNITKPDGTAADLAYLQSLGMTRARVEPVTCQACHDPHTLALRVPDSQLMLPAGFQVAGLGKGTLCAACHNSRNGAHDDAHPPTSFSAPHLSTQADVFVGANAYFVSGYRLSAHAAIAETCVACHVTRVPAAVDTHGSNHRFRPDTSICASCHGAGVTGAGTVAQFEAALASLATQLGDGLLTMLTVRVGSGGSYRVRAWDPATDLYSSASSSSSNVVLADAPTAVTMREIHGQAGFTLTLPNPVTVMWTDGSQTTTSQVSFQLGSLKDMAVPTPLTLFPVDSVMTKAAWNYFLLQYDGSGSLHNPAFAFDVLWETERQVALWRAGL